MDLSEGLFQVLWDFFGHVPECGQECEDETDELVEAIMAKLEASD